MTEFIRRLRHWRSHRRAIALWKQAQRPKPEREHLWRDFQEAELRADSERLAAIGDWVLRGVPIDLFRLTENERIVVDAYVGATREI